MCVSNMDWDELFKLYDVKSKCYPENKLLVQKIAQRILHKVVWYQRQFNVWQLAINVGVNVSNLPPYIKYLFINFGMNF